MKKILYRLWARFLTIFGDIKISKFPMFLQYDPDSFKVTGDQILEIMDVIQDGDIIFRGFDCYADSHFINSKRSYSHAGIYIGNNEIIHAVAPNVEKINIIDFCECDRILILRPRKYQKLAIKNAKSFLKDEIPYDFCFNHGKETLYCFELAAECYSKLNVKRTKQKLFFGLITKKDPVVLSDGFIESDDFKLVYEYNPKYNIDIRC